MSAQLGITDSFLQQETVSYRRVSSRGFRDQSEGWRIGVRGDLRRSGTWRRCSHNLQSDQHACSQWYLQTAEDPRYCSWCFEQILGRLGMFYFSDAVYGVSISWNYILLRVTNNFGLGKWTKTERDDGKVLRVKTSPVDWRVYTWERWVTKTIYQNRIGHWDLLLKLPGMTACPKIFP